jgi:hypothetical protein
MLVCTARALLRTVAAMIAPCSLKSERCVLDVPALFKITDCDLERCVSLASSGVSRNTKSGGKRSALRLIA